MDTPPVAWRAPSNASAGTHWLVGCTELGFSWIGVRLEEIAIVPISHPEPGNGAIRFNDGKTGPDGRFWAGTMDNAERAPTGSFYAFAEDGGITCIDRGYIVSNGPAFGPDGRTLYHTDSALRVIYAFDLDAEARALNRRVLIQFDEDDGCPDGMTTDSAGNLWVAMWDGGRVQKLSAKGERLRHVLMPVARPTSCVFAGERELYVTSASLGAPHSDGLAGGLFRITLP